MALDSLCLYIDGIDKDEDECLKEKKEGGRERRKEVGSMEEKKNKKKSWKEDGIRKE